MSARATRRGFAARPGDAESWIKTPDAQAVAATSPPPSPRA